MNSIPFPMLIGVLIGVLILWQAVRSGRSGS
jgi:hypothetical protein